MTLSNEPVSWLPRDPRLEGVSYAILGYSGGKALALADHPIHMAVNDMQASTVVDS